jgi:hypothetical protein
MEATKPLRFESQKCGMCDNPLSVETVMRAAGEPVSGEVATCLGCGTPYRLRRGCFRTLTAQQFARLDPQLRHAITENLVACLLAAMAPADYVPIGPAR